MTISTALTPIERAAVALKSNERETALKVLATEAKEITAITNADGYKQCHTTRMNLKNERVEIARQGKEAREDATIFSKAVIAEEKRLIEIIEPEETRLEKIQKEWDDKIAAEKQAKINAEIKRVENIRAAINSIRAFVIDVAGKDSKTIANVQDILNRETIDKAWYEEFTEEATKVKAEVLEKLSVIHQAAVNHEAEQARIIAERAELAKLKSEHEERLRIERIAEDKRKAEQAVLDAQRAELNKMLEAQEAELKRREEADKEKLRLETEARERQEEEARRIELADTCKQFVAEVQEQVAEQKAIEPEMVTITTNEYRGLLKDRALLEALCSAGVDNWDGFDLAIEMLEVA